MNPNDPQFQIAQAIFKDLCDNISQWLPQAENDHLNQIIEQYGVESVEYKEEAKRLILKYLDQANEWIEDHAHVEYTQETTFSPGNSSVNGSDSTQGTDGVNDAEEDGTIEAPEYSRGDVMSTSSLDGDYRAGTDRQVGRYKHEDSASGVSATLAMAKQDLTAAANALAQYLKNKLGDNYDPIFDEYINKAINLTLDDLNATRRDDSDSDKGNDNNHTDAFEIFSRRQWRSHDRAFVYDVRAVVDHFFDEFDALCANNGKTAEEVQAEKEAEAAKAAQEKAGYQALWELDINEAADEAGVDDVTAVPTGNNQFAEIQEKAQNDILKPLIAKIREKMAGKGIPDSDLETILNEAADAAVANPNNWASTSNNYTYLIDEDKLTDIFNQNIKKAIKARGYEF